MSKLTAPVAASTRCSAGWAWRAALIACALALAAWLLPAQHASALQFGESGEGAGQIGSARGLAVSAFDHDVYVTDTKNDRVDVFSESGEFRFAWGWGVDASDPREELQTCTAASGCRAGGTTSAHRGGELNEPTGIAVDDDALSPSYGDVYVQDSENHRIEKFGPDGEFLLAFGGGVDESSDEDVCVLAAQCRVGATGTADGEFESWKQLEFIGAFMGPVLSVPASGAAAGRVYVGDHERVQVFGEDGEYEAQIQLPAEVDEPPAEVIEIVAADDGDVYVMYGELTGAEYHRYLAKYVAVFEADGGEVSALTLPASGRLGEGLALIEEADKLVIPCKFGEIGAGEQQALCLYSDAGALIDVFATEEPYLTLPAWSASAQQIYGLSGGGIATAQLPPPGPLVVGKSVTAQPGLADTAMVAATINPEGEASSYYVEYGPTAAYGKRTATQNLAASFEFDGVTASLTEVEPETEIHYKVVASSAAGVVESEGHTFLSPPAVSIEAQWASEVTATSATFNAELDVYGSATEYEFEYGTRAAYEASGGFEASTPLELQAAPGAGAIDVSAQVQGLAEQTAIVWRVSAVKEGRAYRGGVQELLTPAAHASFELADERIWEYAGGGFSGAGIRTPWEGVYQAAEGGEAITYDLRGPSEREAQSARDPESTQEISRHGADGWTSTDLAVPQSQSAGVLATEGPEYRLFSTSLRAALVSPVSNDGELLSVEAGPERTPLLREEGEGSASYEPLVTSKAPYADIGPEIELEEPLEERRSHGVEVLGANADLGSMVLSSRLPLVKGAAEGALYEWNASQPAAQRLQPVSVLPAREGGGRVKGFLGGAQEAGGGQVEAGVRGAVSASGELVFWGSETRIGEERALYVRDTALGETVRLDVVQAGASGAGKAAPIFQAASADGARVFFTDTQALTAGASAATGTADLYECEVGVESGKLGCTLRDLTGDVLDPGEAAGVLGAVAGVSEDGRELYFVANGVLAAGASPGDCSDISISARSSATCNLYVAQEREGAWTIGFIATLSNEDEPDWAIDSAPTPEIQTLSARSSPNGRYFAFMSDRSLTGYDNRDAASGAADEEAYIYDSQSGKLACVSCTPSGAAPTGVLATRELEDEANETEDISTPLIDYRGFWDERWLAGRLPMWTPVNNLHDAQHQPAYLSDEGRLFFDSPVALVPQDANGVTDVYEYEPAGVGSCAAGAATYSAAEEGCISLVSSGTSGEESILIDASASGDDAFFMSAAGLAGQPDDSAYRIYDAHSCEAGTSWPCAAGAPVVPPPCTTTSSCRGAPSPQPSVFGPPPSATFSGQGNLAPSKPAGKPKRAKAKSTRAAKLRAALKRCKRKKRAAQADCRRQARKRYGKRRTRKTKGEGR